VSVVTHSVKGFFATLALLWVQASVPNQYQNKAPWKYVKSFFRLLTLPNGSGWALQAVVWERSEKTLLEEEMRRPVNRL
jgi:hypothetical protein